MHCDPCPIWLQPCEFDEALAEAMQRYADIFARPGFNGSWVWDEAARIGSAEIARGRMGQGEDA